MTARRAGLLAILVGVIGFHLWAASVTIRHSNQDFTASDQGAEMWLASLARADALPQRTDGVRHPLWSWIARNIHCDDQAAFFARGKWLNTALCCAFLAGLGLVASPKLGLLATANLLLLCSLGLLLVRGTYFQPEPIYYILSFGAAVLAWRILRGGAGWGDFLAFGVTCGLAYLAKPSLAPFLLAFAGACAVRLALRARETLVRLGPGLVLAGVIFAVIITPLGLFSKNAFGKPFFNYTQFWMWMDDFETEAWPFQDKYPGGRELANLPPSDKPSAAWYFQRHSPSDAGRRLLTGTGEVVVRFLFPEKKVPARALFWRGDGRKWEQPLAHRGIWLLVLIALCAVLAPFAAGPLRAKLREPGFLGGLAFVVFLAGIYAFLYGWYVPIGRGDRFMGSLWIPLVFLACWGAAWLRERSAPCDLSGRIHTSVHGLLLASLLIQAAGIAWLFGHGIFLITKN